MSQKDRKTAPARAPRQRTEEEMRHAVAVLSNGLVADPPFILPHGDDPADILQDVISEMMTLRQLRADVLAFMQDQQTKLQRR